MHNEDNIARERKINSEQPKVIGRDLCCTQEGKTVLRPNRGRFERQPLPTKKVQHKQTLSKKKQIREL